MTTQISWTKLETKLQSCIIDGQEYRVEKWHGGFNVYFSPSGLHILRADDLRTAKKDFAAWLETQQPASVPTSEPIAAVASPEPTPAYPKSVTETESKFGVGYYSDYICPADDSDLGSVNEGNWEVFPTPEPSAAYPIEVTITAAERTYLMLRMIINFSTQSNYVIYVYSAKEHATLTAHLETFRNEPAPNTSKIGANNHIPANTSDKWQLWQFLFGWHMVSEHDTEAAAQAANDEVYNGKVVAPEPMVDQPQPAPTHQLNSTQWEKISFDLFYGGWDIDKDKMAVCPCCGKQATRLEAVYHPSAYEYQIGKQYRERVFIVCDSGATEINPPAWNRTGDK